MNHDVMAKIRSSLSAVEKALEDEPLIFIDEKGDYWLNDHARDFISHREIPAKDFMEWLTIGSSHLQNFSYGDITIHMMRLPENNVVVFLKSKPPGEKMTKSELTPKEREVLGYLIKGFSNKQIAEFMKITTGTVNSHLDKIYSKLGCSNRVAAGFLGLKNGLFLPACGGPSAAEP
jgi:DNA-binding CsgD family transcriptional regulator